MKNAEINQYEAKDPFQVSFDYTGNCVIVRDGLLDIDDRSTKIDAFDFDDYWLEKASVMEKLVDQE